MRLARIWRNSNTGSSSHEFVAFATDRDPGERRVIRNRFACTRVCVSTAHYMCRGAVSAPAKTARVCVVGVETMQNAKSSAAERRANELTFDRDHFAPPTRACCSSAAPTKRGALLPMRAEQRIVCVLFTQSVGGCSTRPADG